MVPIPWQQFSNPVLRHVCDASEHIGQPCLRIDVVELGRHDQRGHGRRPVSAALGTGEEPRLSPQRKSSKSTLGCIVREADPAIFDEAGKPVPTLEHVVDRLGDRGRVILPGPSSLKNMLTKVTSITVNFKRLYYPPSFRSNFGPGYKNLGSRGH